mgnify:CR=1 FL=1
MKREKSIEVLNSLITINNDRIEGYETASKETEEVNEETCENTTVKATLCTLHRPALAPEFIETLQVVRIAAGIVAVTARWHLCCASVIVNDPVAAWCARTVP